VDLSQNRIRTSLELRSLPGYREPVDPARAPLQRIHKPYRLEINIFWLRDAVFLE
jgi:hypothetical protein